MNDTIGKVHRQAKIAAGLFWADYSVLGAQVREFSRQQPEIGSDPSNKRPMVAAFSLVT